MNKEDLKKTSPNIGDIPCEKRRRGRPRRAENADFKPVTFHVNKDQYRQIGEIADRDRRSIKQTLFLIIEAGLEALKRNS